MIKHILLIATKNIWEENHKNEIMKYLIEKNYNPYIIKHALGHSLMVEHRTLTPLVLVRIQLPQPKIQTPLVGVLIFIHGSWIGQSNAVAHDQYENTQLEKF